MPEATTLPEPPRATSGADASPEETVGLVVCACPGEPGRAGESLVVPPGTPGPPRTFGRGAALGTDPHPRVLLVRERPGSPSTTSPLALEHLSRVQLILRARERTLEVRNVGQCPLTHGGEVVTEVTLQPGDVVTLGRQLMLLCVLRPSWLPGAAGLFASGEFGRADRAGMVGESAALWQLRRQVEFVAQRAGHVLVTGPSGTGKELVARALHAASSRAAGPFVSRSAATLPEGLIDAELFGNARNFPQAGMAERPGLVGAASSGTLFLDELAELPVAQQAHLLRVMDSGEYQRLGEATRRSADLRIVAATNRAPSSLKDDLLARFPFQLTVPGLNERREDIPLLVRHLLHGMATENPPLLRRFFAGEQAGGEPRLAFSFLERLVRHEYSLHVRELARELWSAVEKSPGDTLVDPLAASPPRSRPLDEASPAVHGDSARGEGLTASRVQAVLDEHNGALEPTRRALGLTSRHALSRLIARYGLEVRRRPGRPRT